MALWTLETLHGQIEMGLICETGSWWQTLLRLMGEGDRDEGGLLSPPPQLAQMNTIWRDVLQSPKLGRANDLGERVRGQSYESEG